jgi:hypothetical protein
MAHDDKLSREDNIRYDEEARILKEVEGKKWHVRLRTYFKLSGPGWLQSALTLGGGSLTSSLYLGVLAGVSMLWLQPLAMLLGIIMLAALGYATLATDQRPLYAINEHINPVLGWGWAIASILACVVWVMPQFALANGVVQQNLLPQYLGTGSALGNLGSTILISALILIVTLSVTYNYGKGSRGVRIFEMLLKEHFPSVEITKCLDGEEALRCLDNASIQQELPHPLELLQYILVILYVLLQKVVL